MNGIKDAIRQRRSVRSFTGDELSALLREELLGFSSNLYNPFGGDFTVRLKKFDLKNGYRPATYGMIRGAVDFFLIGMADDEQTALAVGFCFEQVVLKARLLGLGSCWIAATFRGSDFDKGEVWPENEKLRIVCPVGYEAEKRMVEKIAGLTLGSRSRRPFEKLFFTDRFEKPLPADSVFAGSLEMMRLAPSSKNSQPWRALVDGDAVHFYYVPEGHLSVLDCGIGICHFYESEKADGRKGRFFRAGAAPAVHGRWKYLVSYRKE